MKLRNKILRTLAPHCEKQRMEFRKARHEVEATAEDLVRTIKEIISDQKAKDENKAD